jgi:nitrogenase molybdenum-iron protein alpha/beta subunit
MSAEYEVTRNSCVVCAPLGATLAFAGIKRGMTLLHGSQGCATYIRRYAISHFREPLDVGSSSFTEETAVFGGRKNLRLAFENMVREYKPDLVGVATTCLAETIGEDGASARRSLERPGHRRRPPRGDRVHAELSRGPPRGLQARPARPGGGGLPRRRRR